MVLLSHLGAKLQSLRMKDYFKYEGAFSAQTGNLMTIPCRIARRNRCTIFFAIYVVMMFAFFLWMYLENSQFGNTDYELQLHRRNKAFRGTRMPLKKDFCQFDQTTRTTPTFFKINEDNYVLAAYKDDRSWNSTVIKIFGLSRNVASGYCLVENTETGYTEVAPMTINYLSSDDDKEFRTVSITCNLEIPLAENPCYVRLSKTTNSKQQYIKLPLHSMYQADLQHSFTVCLPVLAGPIPQSQLVEFMEFHKILGADHFHIYQYAGDSQVNEANMNIAAVLEHYNDNDRVTIAPWKLPVPRSSVHHYGSSLANQHCLYQNMWTSQFLFFPSLYQYLIPKDSTNWFNMLRPLTKPPGTKFCFQSFHFPPVVGDLLITMASLEKAPKPNKKILCLITPVHADLADDHSFHCEDDLTHLHVDINKGFVHDYRHRDKTVNTSVLVTDLSATKFKYELQIAFKRTMKLLFDTQMEKYLDAE